MRTKELASLQATFSGNMESSEILEIVNMENKTIHT